MERLKIFSTEAEALRAWIDHCKDPGDEGITIYVKDVNDDLTFIASTQKMGANTMSTVIENQWVRNNQDLFSELPNTILIYDSRPDYQCLAAKADIHPDRLNAKTTVGMALTAVEDSISLPRIAAIQKAIATGKSQKYSYSHNWNEMTWHFDCNVIPLPENEVMCIVSDSNRLDCLWQREYWIRRLVDDRSKT